MVGKVVKLGAVGAVLVVAAVIYLFGFTATPILPSQTYHAELEYLKAIHNAGPSEDPRLILLLMAQFLNANQSAAGLEFYETFLDKHDARLSPQQKAYYLGALGLIRAAHASKLSLPKRLGWIRETITLLESARELGKNELFMLRWITGVVYAQLPELFNQKDIARADLQWCLEHISEAPDHGWLREIYYFLAYIYHTEDDTEQAEAFLQLSGYNDFDKQIYLTTPFSVDSIRGQLSGQKRLTEVIPGQVFALTGFEFSEFYFMVSEDGKELIAIDTGTTPDSAEEVFHYLQERFPDLPPLTTVFITHAHWDHLGGHHYFRRLNPQVNFYARDNYHEELDIVTHTPITFTYFLGADFKMEEVADFKPTHTIAAKTELQVGGTRIELIPIAGGETHDGLFIHLPDHSVLFAGDFVMPYFGGPFLEEGSIPGLFDAIDVVLELNPNYILFGHEPLSRLFPSAAMLGDLKKTLEWLYHETLRIIRSGSDRASIHHANLIPPFLGDTPDMHLPYLVMRENFINRVWDQSVGYWNTSTDMEGMDHLSQAEYGLLLTHYLGLSEKQLETALDKMVSSGDHELAARTVTWALTQYPASARLAKMKEKAFLKLKEKYQTYNPFKFAAYSDWIQNPTPPLESDEGKTERR